MPLQYRSDTALHNGLAEHAASASASVRSDGSFGAMNVVHCIEGTCVYEIVSHCGLVVPWQNAGGAHTEPPHNGGGGDAGDGDTPEEQPPAGDGGGGDGGGGDGKDGSEGGDDGFTHKHALALATCPPPLHSA